MFIRTAEDSLIDPNAIEALIPGGPDKDKTEGWTYIILHGRPFGWTHESAASLEKRINEALDPTPLPPAPNPWEPSDSEKCQCVNPDPLASKPSLELIPVDAWIRCVYCRKLYR